MPTYINSFIHKGKLSSEKIITVTNIVSANKAVLANLGFTFLPEYMIRKELKNGQLIKLNAFEKDNQMNIYFSCIKSKILDDVAKEIIKQVKKLLGPVVN